MNIGIKYDQKIVEVCLTFLKDCIILLKFPEMKCEMTEIIVINENYEKAKQAKQMHRSRNSSKTNEPHVQTNSEPIITFARHKYGRVRVFKIKIGSIVQKL